MIRRFRSKWLVLALLWAGSAAADSLPPWKVVLLTANPPAELEAQIRSELSARGFELSIRHGSIRPSQLAAEEKASMVIGLGTAAVDIWVRVSGAGTDGRTPGRMRHTRYEVEAGAEGSVAIQVAEFARAAVLHASAREVRAPSAPREVKAPVQPTRPAVAVGAQSKTPAAGRLSFASSVGIVYSRGQFDPITQLAFSAAWWSWSYVGVELSGYVPLGFRDRGAGRSFVGFSPYMLGAGVRAGTHRPDARWNFDAALGAGVLLSHAYGLLVNDAGAAAKLDDLNANPFGYLRVGISLRLAGPVRLRADALGGVSKLQAIGFPPGISGTWGEWGEGWLSATLGLELLAM